MTRYAEEILKNTVTALVSTEPLPANFGIDLDTLSDEEIGAATILIFNLAAVIEYATANVPSRLRSHVLSVTFEEIARREGVLVDTSPLDGVVEIGN